MVPDLVDIASSPDADAFIGGVVLMFSIALLSACTVGLVNFIRRIVSV